MTQENDIRLAYINTLLDSGFTHLIDEFSFNGIINPTEGYIVGGVTDDSTMEQPDFSSIANYKEFKQLWCRYAMKVPQYSDWDGKRAMGVGTWIHKGKIYFDLVQHFNDLDMAAEEAKVRGEIAIYDCANQKEITL